jgi:antitoxin (DNA-binding transcriptional repressor) of toxin-antitoxin stability system
MRRATVEEFRKNAGALLQAVERGERFIIACGEEVVARLPPAEDDQITNSEHEE